MQPKSYRGGYCDKRHKTVKSVVVDRQNEGEINR